MFAANLIYNFDSINYFSQDKRVMKTIYEKSTHEDFLYVVKKINKVVGYFIKMFTQQNIKEKDFTSKLSKKEYSISGICQECQNKIFGGN